MKYAHLLIISALGLTPISVCASEFIDFSSLGKNTSDLITRAQQQPQSQIADQSWNVSKQSAQSLLTARIGQSVFIENFPQDLSYPESQILSKPTNSILKLKRYEIFSPSARIYVVSDSGQEEVSRPDLHAFSSISAGVGILVDTNTGEVTGLYNSNGTNMEISGNLETTIEFRRTLSRSGDDQSSYQCGTTMADQPGDPFAQVTEALSSRSVAISSNNTPSYQTTIAVDTDMEWMAGKNDNTQTALNYINSLFVNMNVFMESDLSLRLLIGTTYLRVGSDPIPAEPAIFEYLNDFSEYWRLNEAAVDRDFTILLSGENISSNSFSGIAWLNVYCNKGDQFGPNTVGSYSVNRVGSNASTGFISQFVGHEIGHNLGSPHTHCYNPVVDTCFNDEAGCYDGSVSCPISGQGTIMSYCHYSGANGANCGSSNSEFHPTVIGLFSSRIVANSPSCIAPLAASDEVFEDSFE